MQVVGNEVKEGMAKRGRKHNTRKQKKRKTNGKAERSGEKILTSVHHFDLLSRSFVKAMYSCYRVHLPWVGGWIRPGRNFITRLCERNASQQG